jgi:signal transduction histidine kinase
LDGERTTDVDQATRLSPLADLARAATGPTDRSSFLPIAARETTRLFGAEACEIWLDEDGPTLAAAFRQAGSALESASVDLLVAVLEGGAEEQDGWLALPVPGTGTTSGVLSLYRDEAWTTSERLLAEVCASFVGLAIQARAGGFDSEERDQFLALVGHDLRSPLANVRVGAQLAVRNLEAGDIDSVEAALGIIENQSGRLVDRLEALLAAVAARGGQLVRLESLDLGELAQSTVEPYRLAAEETGSGTTFEVAAKPNTPLARGDAGQVGQVLQQLVDNASKYATGGHVVVTISADGHMARVDVCDDGPGIRPEDVDRIFAPFGRGQAAAGQDGYGLGLYLARNIISTHGGRLWVSRTSRSGTCMSFTLPVSSSEDR